ncbi:MAG: excisionase family DNA-binding protein [Candidatus Sulfotelmatobacter sp.]
MSRDARKEDAGMGMGMGMKLAAARAPASLDDPEFTSVAGAAALMMVSEETIRKMLTRKRLKRYKFGGRTLVKVAELRAHVKEAK